MSIMTADAQAYHRFQIDISAGTGVAMVTSLTFTNVPKEIGVASLQVLGRLTSRFKRSVAANV